MQLINPELARNVVGAFVLLMLGGIIAALFMLELPTGNREVALIVLGAMVDRSASIINFHYGTSEGSKTKTSIMSGKGDPL